MTGFPAVSDLSLGSDHRLQSSDMVNRTDTIPLGQFERISSCFPRHLCLPLMGLLQKENYEKNALKCFQTNLYLFLFFACNFVRSSDYGTTYTKLNLMPGTTIVVTSFYICPTNKKKVSSCMHFFPRLCCPLLIVRVGGLNEHLHSQIVRNWRNLVKNVSFETIIHLRSRAVRLSFTKNHLGSR